MRENSVATDESPVEAFTTFFASVEPRLRYALIASYGPETGREAASDALAWAWEHWDQVRAMGNPAGYLYRVGCTSARRYRRRPSKLDTPDPSAAPWIEPRLDGALDALSHRQRTAVVLKHSFGWTHAEIGELLGVTVPTVQKHVTRGLGKLRKALEVEVGT